jgi:exodeoxyribonuclease VII large subunit
MKIEGLSLSQLNLKIKACIQKEFSEPVWVVAEISELRVNTTGHCYMELIEKAEAADQIIAKIKAMIWSFTYRMIGPYFETTTGYRLAAGLKVLIKVQPEFHEVYGISLVVKDIDPSYTLGDLARLKREILRKLQSEGVIDMNRMLAFPLVPQRIAVISSGSAAGYGDFMDTLHKNSGGFYFYTELFAAIVQGDKAPESIIQSLERIYERENEFDLVVIIRGGGAQSDLDCFNNYELVYHITQFPLPVISGIGHERDETITDIVAHTSVKTPTAAAEFLIDAVSGFDDLLEGFKEQLVSSADIILSEEKEKISQLSQKTVSLVHGRLNDESNFLVTSRRRLFMAVQQFTLRKKDRLNNFKYRTEIDCNSRLKSEFSGIGLASGRLSRGVFTSIKVKKEQLSVMEKNIEYLDPEKVLMRGYSISSSGGKLIKDASVLREGDELTTRFHKGEAMSIVRKKIKQ